MNQYLKYLILSITVSVLWIACSKEFDSTPGNQFSEDKLFESEEGFKAAANGLYATLQNMYYYGGSMISIPELYTPYSQAGGYDDPTLSRIFDAAIGDNQNTTMLEATNPRIRNIWVSIYNTIRACNVFLSHANNNESKPNVIQSEAVWNNLKGQAKAIRALAHFDLLRLFGEHWNTNSKYGIPVMTTVPNPDSKPYRKTVQETYDAILADLDESLVTGENGINPLAIGQTGKNYIDSIVIKALKARVYLYKGDKITAATFAQNVIDHAGIELTTDLNKYYASRNSNEENIFELSFSTQNSSNLNLWTFKNETAFVNDLNLGIDTAILNTYFLATGDISADRASKSQRYAQVFLPKDLTPRTNKYASFPGLKNNPAYIIRLSEMFLILAETRSDLNTLSLLRTKRNVGVRPSDVFSNNLLFSEIIAELNFEGAHVMCARARLNIHKYQENGKGIFPIPQAELLANPNMTQNPIY